jgi:tripartite-type tricarboxylate transporter receptor subunit TctC
LAVSTARRSPFAPDLPTIAESGYSNFEFDSYQVLAAPAGLPEAVAGVLEREVQLALASPDLQDKLRAQDILIAPTPGVGAKARITSDFEKWAKVVKATGMQVD